MSYDKEPHTLKEDLIKLKIKAFLHDPPEKAVILMQKVVGHEKRGRELLRRLIGEDDIEEVKKADVNASSADRINLPESKQKFLDEPCIKHPLSGDELPKTEELKQKDPNIVIHDAMQAVDKAVNDIKDECGDDLQKIYLSLWRKLPDLIKDQSSIVKTFWDVLPADTRIPDHSIWNHRNSTSAIASGIETLPPPEPDKKGETICNLSFLLFSLGPVQEFIATARKTQDLWMGSYMLSFLAWHAMQKVVEEFGPDAIVFPDLYKQPLVDKWLCEKIKIAEPDINLLSTPTLPNRFLAILPTNKEGRHVPSEIAERAKESVLETWHYIANAVKEGLERELKCKSPVWDSIWDRQTGDFIETYWVAHDWKQTFNEVVEEYKSLVETKADDGWDMGKILSIYADKAKHQPTLGTMYQLLYDLAERFLGSRKAIRDFKQSEEPNYKCTLCGVREPLIDKDDPKPKESRDFWKRFAKIGLAGIRSDGGERLCAVCATKRFALKFYFTFKGGDLGFPSVGTIANGAYQYSIVKNAGHLREAIKEYNEKVEGFLKSIKAHSKSNTLPIIKKAVNTSDKELQKFIEIDGEWLYKESYNEKRLEKEYEYEKCSEEKLNDARDALKKLKDAIASLSIEYAKPSKYYAVLYMDGDNMGKWLSGAFAPKIGDILHPQIARPLDEDLKNLKRPLSPALHSSISSALRNFSLELARHIVEEKYLGKLVYAGGDDILAFVNLNDLLNVMRDLRGYFSGNVDETGNTDFTKGNGFIEHDGRLTLTMGRTATASMGVAIAHYLQPLNQVINKVREMEKFAKNIDSDTETKNTKNAFAISLLKRSGETEVIRAKWFYDNGSTKFDTINFINELVGHFTSGALSTRFAYDFREKLKWMNTLNMEATHAEVLRLLNRHMDKEESRKDLEEEKKSIAEGIMELGKQIGKIGEVSKVLSLAVFLSKQGRGAE